jgi:hypothetical protein
MLLALTGGKAEYRLTAHDYTSFINPPSPPFGQQNTSFLSKNTLFFSRTRYPLARMERFSFDGDNGKTAYFRIRRENGKGEAGKFGPMFQGVIL